MIGQQMISPQTHFREATRRWVGRWVETWKDRLLACSAPDCSRSRRAWHRFSDGAASLSLNGLRYCFPSCLEQELTRRFQEAESRFDPKPRPPHRVPLGLLMLSRGDLDPVQLNNVLSAQRDSGTGRIGEWIEKLGYAREPQVTSALATQWACPVLRRLPLRAADCGVPYQLHVAFSCEIDYPVLLAIEEMLECKTAPCLTPSTELAGVLTRMEEDEVDPRPEKVFDGLRSPEEMARITSSYAARLGPGQIRTAVCGEYVWIRMEGRAAPTDLLFARKPADTVHRRQFPATTAG